MCSENIYTSSIILVRCESVNIHVCEVLEATQFYRYVYTFFRST